MQLNEFEKYVVSHPLRFWVQNNVEAPLLLKLFTEKPKKVEHALEVGCGFGNGVSLIKKHFLAEYITAIDFDAEMAAATQYRYQNIDWLTVANADASCLPFENEYFDIAFNFAVFHHIPNWQKAVEEIYRVLKPNGYFVIEDLYRAAICNPLSKRLFEHPQDNRFNHNELLNQLQLVGFSIEKSHNLFNLAGSILARKPEVS